MPQKPWAGSLSASYRKALPHCPFIARRQCTSVQRLRYFDAHNCSTYNMFVRLAINSHIKKIVGVIVVASELKALGKPLHTSYTKTPTILNRERLV